MKLRQKPEDFQVEEIAELDISQEKKAYKIFLLEKKSLETFALLKYLSKKNNIPSNEFGIAGLKDKHAITRQHFTIPSRFQIRTLKEQNFKITPLGYVEKALKLGELEKNLFKITVRDVKKGELEGIYQKAKTLPEIGVPNYFDSQRFGSAIHGEFIAKYILQKKYEKAVKIFLTSYTKSEHKGSKDEKRKILASWNNLENVHTHNTELGRVVEEYKRTKSWLEAYKQISPSLREIYISAYQSYLWNECVKQLLRKVIDGKYTYTIKYNAGSLVFYKRMSEDEKKKIPATFKTISDELKTEGEEKEIIDEVLKREGITMTDFKIKNETGNFFKTHERKIVLMPGDFKIAQPELDELNDKGKNNRMKIALEFSLGKGSYATIITKRVFNQ